MGREPAGEKTPAAQWQRVNFFTLKTSLPCAASHTPASKNEARERFRVSADQGVRTLPSENPPPWELTAGRFPVSFSMISATACARRIHALAGVDDEIGQPALLRRRAPAWRGSPRTSPRSCRAATAPVALHFGRGGHHNDLVDAVAAVGLEQQRYVDARPAARPPLMPPQEGRRHRRAPADARSPPAVSTLPVAEHMLGKLHPIDDAVRRRAWKGRFDQRRRLAAIEPMHRLVGIVHRHAEVARTSSPSSTCPCRSSRSGRARSWLFRRSRLHVGDDHSAQFPRHIGPPAEPALEARHRLMQQHAEPVDRLQPAPLGRPPAAASPAAHRRCR